MIDLHCANTFADRKNFGRVDTPNRQSDSSDSAPMRAAQFVRWYVFFHFVARIVSLFVYTFVARIVYIFVSQFLAQMSMFNRCSCFCLFFPLLCVYLLYMRVVEKTQNNAMWEIKK